MAENPSAFPHNGIDSDNEFSWPSTGMTLRDYFAGKALQELMSARDLPAHVTRYDICAEAYNYADAMLAAREATP